MEGSVTMDADTWRGSVTMGAADMWRGQGLGMLTCGGGQELGY